MAITLDKKAVNDKVLPKDFAGREQANYNIENTKRNSDPERLRKEFQKRVDASTKLLMAGIKNQPIDKPLKQSELIRTFSDINQSYIAQMQFEQMQDLSDSLKYSNPAQYLNHDISYDDSIRNFVGPEVAFNYQIDYDDSQIPDGYNIETKIKVYDSSGKVVYTGTGAKTKGKHEFIWSGRDSSGKKVEKGEYRIEGMAVARSSSDSKKFIDLDFSAHILGKVDHIDYEEGKPYLMVGGRPVHQKNILRVRKHQDKEEAKQINAQEYVGYIGKTVSYDLSQFTVNQGKAEISYNNPDVANPGKFKVEVYDADNKFIKTVDYAIKLVNGRGSFALDALKNNIPDGRYHYKIKVENKDEDNRLVVLPHLENLSVNGLDIADKKFISNSRKYDLENIISVTDPAAKENSLYAKGASYIGKQVQYTDGQFQTQNGEFTSFVSIDRPSAGQRLGDAELVIYKDDKEVARLTKAAASLYHHEIEAAPSYNQLNNYAQGLVKHHIRSKLRLPGVTEYAHLDQAQKLEVNNYIEQKFRSGEFFKYGQDDRSEEDKLKNMGLVKLHWDGSFADGSKALNNESYRYEVYTSTVDNDTNEVNRIKAPNTAAALVSSAEIIDEELKLKLSNGRLLGLDKILAVRG
jgi:flagellar basal-body rod modification protein FlgD